ncbi:MAG: hypothetical protein IT539_05325 [Bradyrhizobiaceae bacterium]|nr:hypothetical protein [Bradyrhizobiaceae bacterium]
MANGVGQRLQIDRETARGLLLANGGGAVALLFALTQILDQPSYDPLTHAMFVGVLVMLFGVALAIAYYHLHRRCLLVHEQHHMNPPKARLFGIALGAPAVCITAAVCMWLSVLTFLGAGSYVAWTGIATLSDLQAPTASARPAAPADAKAKAKAK